MILRIARFTVAAEHEDNVVSALRAQAKSVKRPEGLEDLVFAIGRPDPGAVEFITVTLWTDMEAIVRALGPSWDAPGGVTGIADRVAGRQVEHFDVFADDWPELVAFLEMPLRERRDVEMNSAAQSARIELADAAPVSAIV